MTTAAGGRSCDGGGRLVAPPVFEFVLDAEMRRAVRAQTYLTLVVLETRREWDGLMLTADQGTVEDVARLVGPEVRETDVMGATDGVLSLLLLDADYDSSRNVIDRLTQRIDRYEFPAPVRISIGAACYPTHAVDAATLKEQALTHPMVSWRQTDPKSQTPNPKSQVPNPKPHVPGSNDR